MIYKDPPTDFNSKFDIVSCVVQKENSILLLHRQDHKPQGNTWGLPAGKADAGENLTEALQRELREETGIDQPIGQLLYLGKAYTRYPDYDFVFHMYKTAVTGDINVTLNPIEHKEYIWIDPKEIDSLPIMEDLDACLSQYYL